jgi:FtsH-binding integral membrane protein
MNKFQELRDEPSSIITEKQADEYPSQQVPNETVINVNNEELEEKMHDLMRLGFIRKVYGILTLQLLITVALCSLTFIPEVKLFLLTNKFLFWAAMITSFIIIIPLLCFQNLTRKVPINYILLISWTICEAYMVACVCAIFEPVVVLTALACTFAVTGSITLYACYTKTDFTFMGGFIASSLTLLVSFSFMVFIFPVLNALVCIFGVLLYSLYLLYDTQMIMGRFGHEYSIDDYIIAALSIYLDIIQIFLYILQLVARSRGN